MKSSEDLLKSINKRMVDLQDVIEKNKAIVAEHREEARKIEDMIILQNGALQECANIIKELSEEPLPSEVQNG